MNFTLKIWRQENAKAKGHFETYQLDNISPDCSFLEMLDILNESLVHDKISHPVCFDNDCREGMEFVECVVFTLTDVLMEAMTGQLLVSCICVNLKMEIPFT